MNPSQAFTAFGLVANPQSVSPLRRMLRLLTGATLLATVTGASAQEPAPRPGLYVPADSSVILTGPTVPGTGYRWQYNGYNIGQTGFSMRLDRLQPGHVGLYTPVPLDGSPAPDPTILGIAIYEKAAGYATEVGADILHPSGRTYDQFLLEGAVGTFRADPGQTTRVSFLDLNDDIVQVEFTGAGTLTIWLDQASGPQLPANYNQDVAYMKGHAHVVVAGADDTTHVAIYSVGPITAVNQGLFKLGRIYDGVADIASLSIQSDIGRFGWVRAANVQFYGTRGHTGIYAPGIRFTRPVFVHDITAYDNATPVYLLGEGSDVRVTGGDLFQPNGRAVKVAGITQLKFMNGTDSHGVLLPAKANRARLTENGVDVTDRIVAEVFTQE